MTLTYDTVENAFKQLTQMKTGAYQKYFQFKLLHTRTVTNEKLYKMVFLTQTFVRYYDAKVNQNDGQFWACVCGKSCI